MRTDSFKSINLFIMIEKKTASTILQTPDAITIDGKDYKMPHPTIATLIRVSELVAQFPESEVEDDINRVLNFAISRAKDFKMVGLIAATLVLGETRASSKFDKILLRKKRKEKLADKILHTLSPKELNELWTKMVSRLEIADFFVLTTSLSAVNMTKPTKEVVN